MKHLAEDAEGVKLPGRHLLAHYTLLGQKSKILS